MDRWTKSYIAFMEYRAYLQFILLTIFSLATKGHTMHTMKFLPRRLQAKDSGSPNHLFPNQMIEALSHIACEVKQ